MRWPAFRLTAYVIASVAACPVSPESHSVTDAWKGT
jgi:hypothetical protein